MRTLKRTPALAVLLLALSPAAARAEKVRNHFDSDSPMRPPGFFDLVVLGAPGPARWIILADLNPPSTPNKLAQVDTKRPEGSIAAAIRRNYTFQDGSVSTFLKPSTAREGLVLRMQDEKNFLLLLVDFDGAAVLSSTVGGQTRELGRGKMAPQRPWERYSVMANGPELAVYFNDEKLFDARDPHPVAGRAGLATSGPGEASFDEFILETAETGRKP